MKRVFYGLVFACLIAEGRSSYADGHWITPLRYLTIALFETRLILPVFDWLLLLTITLPSPSPSPSPLRNPMLRAMWVAIATLASTALHGAIRGGSLYQMQFQLHPFAVGFLLTLALRKLLRTPADYITLGRVIVAAACWRALACLAFYLFAILPGTLPLTAELNSITAHEDSVTFSNAACMTLAFAFLQPSRRHSLIALGVCALITLGIVLNNRRLAWIDLACSLAAVYAALPPSAARRVLGRSVLWLAPVLLLYVMIGWGRPEPVWRPIRALTGLVSSHDLSTMSREYENDGLLTTTRASPLIGLGFGHRYIETNGTLAAHSFSQYRYLPHNSVLGLLAFGGLLGFVGTWMIFPVAAFLGFRASLHTRDPSLRLLGLGVLASVVSYMLQMYGDMGLLGLAPCTHLGCALACAAHLADADAADTGVALPPLAAAANRPAGP